MLSSKICQVDCSRDPADSVYIADFILEVNYIDVCAGGPVDGVESCGWRIVQAFGIDQKGQLDIDT